MRLLRQSESTDHGRNPSKEYEIYHTLSTTTRVMPLAVTPRSEAIAVKVLSNGSLQWDKQAVPALLNGFFRCLSRVTTRIMLFPDHGRGRSSRPSLLFI
jgi:hypothetical protein